MSNEYRVQWLHNIGAWEDIGSFDDLSAAREYLIQQTNPGYYRVIQLIPELTKVIEDEKRVRYAELVNKVILFLVLCILAQGCSEKKLQPPITLQPLSSPPIPVLTPEQKRFIELERRKRALFILMTNFVGPLQDYTPPPRTHPVRINIVGDWESLK